MSELYSAKVSLTQSVDSNFSQSIKATQKLIQAASTNPPGDVSAAANAAVALIGEHLPSAEIATHETAPGIINVVAVLHSGRPGKSLVFSGHLDTYPVGNVSQWTVPALGGTISEDGTRIYGRGAADMKGGIAASVIAMCALSQHIDHWDGQIVLTLAGDEETMGHLGTAWLLENVDAVRYADAGIVGDAGSPLVIRTGEKGLLWLELTAKGKSAHGAHVHRGVNAIEALVSAIQKIRELERWPMLQNQVSEVIEAAEFISEPLSGAGKADVLGKITVNVGTIAGGTSMNLVPDSATAKLDIRLPHGITTAKLMEHIDGCLEELDGVSCHIIQQYNPTWMSPSQDIVKCALEAAKAIISPDATVNMRVGASDARLYRQKGIPTVVVGLTPYNMGGPDEYCEVKELVQVAKVHALAAFEFLRPQM